jgi:hypothetical protein
VKLIDPIETGRTLDTIAATSDGVARGDLLEDLMDKVFGAIPGITRTDRDRLSARGNEEVDLAFANGQEPGGLSQFDRDLVVECKSQNDPVDAQAVNWFATKLRRRQQSLGILVALAGVTAGRSGDRAAAAEVELSAVEGRQILIVTEGELRGLRSGEHFANLLTRKRERLISGRLMVIATAEDLEALSPVPAVPESTRLLLHPAQSLAVAEPDLYQVALDAGRLVLRRRRQEAIAIVEARRPVLPVVLQPGVASVNAGLDIIESLLSQLQSSLEREEIDEPSLMECVIELGAACVDLLRLDPATAWDPEPELIAVNVETFAPPRVANHIGSELWALLTCYYVRQIRQVREQLRAVAMYALLSVFVDQILILDPEGSRLGPSSLE